MSDMLLKMTDIYKNFLGTQALRGVDFHLERGEIVSIVGTNGAGKSTLSNIIAGVHTPDQGEILIDGKPVKINNPKDAEKNGIGMVHQEPTLCENMKVFENIFLNREVVNSNLFLARKKMKEESLRVLEYLGYKIDIEAIVQDLPLVSKGIVAIAKAMLMNPKILILDEVSAPLNTMEVEHLFKVIRALKEKGLGIIYISHKIKEIVQISDRVTVMRDGKKVGEFTTADVFNERDIIHQMLGETEGWHDEYIEKKLEQRNDEVLLKVDHLSHRELYEDINIELHKGEIIGLAGLKGSGITELMFTLFGAIKPDSGQIYKSGIKLKLSTPTAAVAHGIGMITNDRQKEGLAVILPVEENISIASVKEFSRPLGFIRKKKIVCSSLEYIKALNIKTTGPNQAVQFLSGGNQQKVVVAKWLLQNADVILIDEPTRGVDIKAKNDIYNLLIEQKKANKGILVFSPEVRELLNICDRIMIMSNGKIVGEITRSDLKFTEKGLLEAMHSSEALNLISF
jgi:ABC-type sugar transport system ATPase subunit